MFLLMTCQILEGVNGFILDFSGTFRCNQISANVNMQIHAYAITHLIDQVVNLIKQIV